MIKISPDNLRVTYRYALVSQRRRQFQVSNLKRRIDHKFDSTSLSSLQIFGSLQKNLNIACVLFHCDVQSLRLKLAGSNWPAGVFVQLRIWMSWLRNVRQIRHAPTSTAPLFCYVC